MGSKRRGLYLTRNLRLRAAGVYLRGYTLAELVIILLILGGLAAMIVPRLNLAIVNDKTAELAARKITADLRRCRGLAISGAAVNSDGYRLEMVGSGGYTGYRIVSNKDGGVVDELGISEGIFCSGDSTVSFGPLGSVIAGGENGFSISGGGEVYKVTVIDSTGIVLCAKQ